MIQIHLDRKGSRHIMSSRRASKFSLKKHILQGLTQVIHGGTVPLAHLASVLPTQVRYWLSLHMDMVR